MKKLGTTMELYDRMSSPLLKIQAASDKTKKSLGGLKGVTEKPTNTSGFDKIKKPLDDANESANRLTGTLIRMAGTIGAAFSIKQIIGISDQITQTNARLNLMNDGLQTTEELNQMIFQSAERARGGYMSTANAVASLGGNAKDAFENTAEIVYFSELLTKQFGIAGTSAEGMSAATLQLTQAMGMGALRGEELNSILEQAPNIVQSIAEYLEVPIGQIKEMASEGQITSQVVKNAMFAAADDINAKFEEMPMTFSQIWTSFKNHALMNFQPVLQRLNDIANSQSFQTFVNTAIQWLSILGHVAVSTFEGIGNIVDWSRQNWSLLAPAIWGVTAALIVYNSIKGIGWLLTIKDSVAKVWNTVVSWAQTAAIIALAFAQGGLNGVIALGISKWMVYAMVIILIIAIFYGLIAVINHLAGTSISATGIIAGVFGALGIFLFNIFVYFVNLIATVAEFFVNVWQHPVYSTRRLFGSLVNNLIDMGISISSSFDGVATNIANAFVSAANIAIGAINWIIGALNKIPGINISEMANMKATSSITGSLKGLQGRVNDWVGEAPSDYWTAPRMEMKSLSVGWDAGYTWGENLENKIKNFSLTDTIQSMLGLDPNDLLGSMDLADAFGDVSGTSPLGDLSDKLGKIADNTGAIKDNTGQSKEDLKYLLDLNKRQVINRNTIQINLDNTNQIVNKEQDLDGVVDYIAQGVAEAIDVTVEGVYD